MQQYRFIDKSKLARLVLGNNLAHLQEHYSVQYSLWHVAPNKLPVDGLVTEVSVPLLPDRRLATYWVQRTTRCIAQSNAPEDGQNCCPKKVELIWIYQ
jgi:hypothetical protein